MSTCGYICPLCSGSGYSDGEDCTWCSPIVTKASSSAVPSAPSASTETCPSEMTDEEWMRQVHEGPCCGDWK